jgi:hypothetical protein
MSEGVTENGILPENEFEEYRAKTSRYRFMNQMYLGIGGATVFGLVAAGVSQLLGGLAAGHIAASTFTLMGMGATTLAVGALGALAVGGIACLYLGSKYLTKNVILDQDFQAKKIGLAASGKTPEIQLPEQGHQPVLPTGMGTMAQLDQDEATHAVADAERASRQWADKFVPAAHRSVVADLARTDAQTWAERAGVAAANDEALAPQLALRA